MEHTDCARDRLAEAAGLRVELCRCCGCIHLTIGAITMRLHRDAVDALGGVLRGAELELTRRDLERGLAPPRGWPS
jgi:hypothetical protein